MHRLSPLNLSPHSSIPSSPIVPATPHTFLVPPDVHPTQRRLLVPTIRHARVPPRRPKTGRLGRHSRSNSLSTEILNKENKEWVSSLGRLHIVEDQLEIRGYQLYAVEKWVVERQRLINVVSVYTGDPNHKITVTALSPFTSLPDTQAQTEFDNALNILRRDGARPRETEHGVILVTSLANFRSDYNLVHIPDGNFLAAREQLYVNINLLRMGCSGRTALTLHAPSVPTKVRFLSMYCFSESVLLGVTFNHCVLELVKHVQGALSLFGMFDVSSEERNGLLCDTTVDGIQRWTDQVGRPMLSLEPMERVGDPSVVSALLSLVVTTRNRLHAIGMTQVPKDPFQDLTGFMHAVTLLHSQRLSGTPATSGCLTLETVEYINDTYEHRAPEYRVPRIILGKLDEITTELNLRGPVDPAIHVGHTYATADLAGFVQMMLVAGSRDAVESLKALWTGKLLHHHRKKTRKDGVDEDEKGTDGKSTEEDDGMPSIFQGWPKHMKIDGLKGFDFGRSRSKKLSVDLTTIAKSSMQKALSGDETPASAQTLLHPPIISGQVEKTFSIDSVLTHGNRDSGAEASSANPSSFGLSPQVSERSSNVNLTSAEARVKPRLGLPTRLPSAFRMASDPLKSSKEERMALLRRASAYEQPMEEEDEEDEREHERRVNRGLLLGATRRRHSMDDLSNLRDTPRLAVERMKVDVGLCGQYLILWRRELHLQNITVLLQHLQKSLHKKNKLLQDDLTAEGAPLEAVTRLREEVWGALKVAETRSSEYEGIQEALSYQTDQMSMKYLWRSVRQQRDRVFAARQAVFAAPPGTRPAPGSANRRFFRVQTTLDPQTQRLVDWAGRTESEVEEERVIPQEEFGAVWPPPYEELRAFAEATRAEAPSKRWWWPLKGRGITRKVYDDDTTATSPGEGTTPTLLSPDD